MCRVFKKYAGLNASAPRENKEKSGLMYAKQRVCAKINGSCNGSGFREKEQKIDKRQMKCGGSKRMSNGQKRKWLLALHAGKCDEAVTKLLPGGLVVYLVVF